MPNNYVLLERIELNNTAASVTFANIPQTGYTDLKIVASMRNTGAGGPYEGYLRFNGVSTSTYSDRWLRGTGSGTPTTTSDSAATGMYDLFHPGAGATANTFGNAEIYIPNYTGNTAKSVSMDVVTEDNATTAYAVSVAGLWTGTSAINEVSIFSQSNSFAAGSSFSLYGIANVSTTPAIAPKADGGNVIATDGTYWYHAFLSNGTFAPQTNLTCDVLVVAGGGGGGYFDLGGPGGAGGLSYQTGRSVTSSVAVQVGAGGTGANPAGGQGGNGINSTFDTIISNGGGGGGGTAATENGKDGGSGGGGAAGGPAGTSSNGGSATQGNTGGATGYGFAGGGGYINASAYGATGGGGGAGAAGTNGTVPSNAIGGNGGNGLNTWSSWATITGTGDSGYYAGGGAGAAGNTGAVAGSRGLGGGGGSGTAGYANTGGGSGGGNGSNGGSGIVIVRYLVAS